MNPPNPLKAPYCQHNEKKPFLFFFFLCFLIIIISRATFAANTPSNRFIFTIFLNLRLFTFLLEDTWRRDFHFLKDTWMAPTTCSVCSAIWQRELHNPALDCVFIRCQIQCLLFSQWESLCRVQGPTWAPYLYSHGSSMWWGWDKHSPNGTC